LSQQTPNTEKTYRGVCSDNAGFFKTLYKKKQPIKKIKSGKISASTAS
jgi:hypothetical protein